MQLDAFYRNMTIFPVLLFIFSNPCLSQQTDSPVAHMSQITETDGVLQKKYISYMSAIAHTSNARKMEKRREELIMTIDESIRYVSRLPLYKGDASLRDTYVHFLKILNTVFREDYHKIVDMEEIAQQSYDNMEAYLLAQERAENKLHEASRKIEPAYSDFAARHKVELTDPEKESKVSKKLETIGKVNEYYHKVYLVFFKSTHQEEYLIRSLQANDINAVEQNRKMLARNAEEGLQKLDSIKAFNRDGSLVSNCRKALQFYKDEAAAKIPLIIDFMLKQDDFERIKKAMEAKSEKQRTQADIDKYNAAVEEMNAGINQYNKTIHELNEERTRVIEAWNAATKKFLDEHIPMAK